MKRTVCLILTLALAFGLCAPALAEETIAVATTQSVLVDGRSVTFETYALLDANGYQTNYAKLRDVAYVLNGTAASFNVSWSIERGVYAETGKPYAANGTEMSTPYSGDRACVPGAPTTQVDGKPVVLDSIVLTDDAGGGYTYYKLRDLGAALGFTVDWSSDVGVSIDTTVAPAPLPDNSAQAAKLIGSWQGTVDWSAALEKAYLEGMPEAAGYLKLTPAPVTFDLTFEGATYTLAMDPASMEASVTALGGQVVEGMMAYLEDYAAQAGVNLDTVFAVQGTTREAFTQQMMDEIRKAGPGYELSQSGQWLLVGDRLMLSLSPDQTPNDASTVITFVTDDHIRLTAPLSDGTQMTMDFHRV